MGLIQNEGDPLRRVAFLLYWAHEDDCNVGDRGEGRRGQGRTGGDIAGHDLSLQVGVAEHSGHEHDVIMVSVVIFGGVKVISNVCEKLVPFMALAYIWGDDHGVPEGAGHGDERLARRVARSGRRGHDGRRAEARLIGEQAAGAAELQRQHTAIIAGGPGAVFWMWITGVFGIATKYSETFAAVKYRVKDHNGRRWPGRYPKPARRAGSWR